MASHQYYNEMLFEDLLYSGFIGETHTPEGWEINSAKIQGLATLVKFLGVQLSEAFRDFPSNVKDILLHFMSFNPRKKHNASSSFGGSIFCT